MNDRLKFRVWDNVDYMASGITLKNLLSGKVQFTSQCPVMQCTALRDKNDVLIYEGDIVEYGSTNRVPFYAVCEFEGCSFGLRVYESVDVNWFDNELAETAHLYEVIGNIHENSELLNKVKI